MSVAGRSPFAATARRLTRALVLLVVAGPIVIGLSQTVRAAFGELPALGLSAPPLAPWAAMLAEPGLARSAVLTLGVGLGATVIGLALALGLAAALHVRAAGIGRWLAPWLAVPHAALALGLAFVLAPSGWIARVLAEVLGWDRPPLLASVNDPFGLALVLGLLVKEVPFLLLVILAAMAQIPQRSTMAAGRSLGYPPATAWLLLVLPQIWPRLRLPVWAVAVYALSVVDMALILGPSNPPVLSVMVLRMYADPDLARLLPASAGAVMQAVLVASGIAALWLAERAVAGLGRSRLGAGLRRGGAVAGPAAVLCAGLVGAIAALGGLAMAALALWSVAWRWPWPLILPQEWSSRLWTDPARWDGPLGATLALAGASTGMALLLAVAWLQAVPGAGVRAGAGGGDTAQARRFDRGTEALIWLPLLVPQIGFLHGLNMGFLRAGLTGGTVPVIWAHLLFVFPYVLLVLSGPWRTLDQRLLAQAAALGAGPVRRLLAVRLPLLLRPLCAAAAIGVAVSVGQFLPTLLPGAGRVQTLTTEAVALAAGADRRIGAVMGALQALVPLAAFALALVVPAVIHRNRRGMSGG